MDERDQTHVEQHGDGDVEVTPPEPAQPVEPDPPEQGDESDGDE